VNARPPTPEQIATDAMTGLAPGHPVDPEFVRELITIVIEADRAQRYSELDVS
jgi:hypothetical protein